MPFPARRLILTTAVIALGLAQAPAFAAEPPLGLPPVPVPADNPVTPEKAALGERLFMDARFSATGEVSCSTCHEPAKVFTDSPRRVSQGINGLTGTRNAPTVVNAAYMPLQFWDGREPDLESQSKQPFLNPVEMGLESHDPILAVIRKDRAYRKAFRKVFGTAPKAITIDHVARAIAAFERTVISGNSPFDRWYYGGEDAAMSDAAKRGFKVFLDKGRCVSCHQVSQTFALFTDGRFHNLNVSFEKIAGTVDALTASLRKRQAEGEDVDIMVLSDVDLSELGRFAVTGRATDIGAFKTPTLRNVARTAPYMHDGSLATLKDVVEFYNNGGRVRAEDPVNAFQSGGIRPLGLSEREKADLVAFMEALTSPQFAEANQGRQ